MKQLSVTEILELPVAERIRLVELIWDSIAAVPEAVSVSEELKAELDRRFSEFEANPEGGSPWEEVRERIVQGKWRTS
jgi:putative addiction module component (TIGR02574 family)